MRRPMRRPMLALLLCPWLAGGCATAALQYGRDGLAPTDRLVRANLEAGQYGSAYEAALSRDAASRDRLLRALTAGALGLYASRTDSSVWALDRAWALTEDRWSKRLGNAVASLVVNDWVLPYVPGETERMFIPLYGALSWLSRGTPDEAAVEARRLMLLLGTAPDDSVPAAEHEVRGLMHYVAGAVFEAAGERGDAGVAYRNAARLVSVPVVRDSTIADSLAGEVVVVLELGFVGHPVPREETIWLSNDELGLLRLHDDEHSLQTARAIHGRESMRRGGPYGERHRYDVGVSINWSEFSDGRPVLSRSLADAVGVQAMAGARGNVSRAVRADFERGQAARFARALVRAAGRATLVKAAGDQLAKAGDDAVKRDSHGARNGDLPRGKEEDRKGKRDGDGSSAAKRVLAGIGLFAVVAASELNDIPDLRSWNVLPYELRVVRLRLPAGIQDVHVFVDGQDISVGRADVRPGRVTVLAQRFFSAPAPAGTIAADR